MVYNKDLENDIEVYIGFKREPDGTWNWHICSDSQTKLDENEYPTQMLIDAGITLKLVVDKYNENEKNK